MRHTPPPSGRPIALSNVSIFSRLYHCEIIALCIIALRDPTSWGKCILLICTMTETVRWEFLFSFEDKRHTRDLESLFLCVFLGFCQLRNTFKIYLFKSRNPLCFKFSCQIHCLKYFRLLLSLSNEEYFWKNSPRRRIFRPWGVARVVALGAGWTCCTLT